MVKNFKNIGVIVSWISMINVVFLYAEQIKTVNSYMWLFLAIVPTLIYLPMLFRTTDNAVKIFKLLMLLVSYIIFVLATIAMFINSAYPLFVRIIISTLSFVGILSESLLWLKDV